jgi:hypothetical protein
VEIHLSQTGICTENGWQYENCFSTEIRSGTDTRCAFQVRLQFDAAAESHRRFKVCSHVEACGHVAYGDGDTWRDNRRRLECHKIRRARLWREQGRRPD